MIVKQPKLNWNGKLTPLDIKAVKFIVVHHAEHANATIDHIHQWHLNNGWTGCGYNEVIAKDGTVYIGRGDNVGGHVQGFNSISYGICLIGSYDVETTMPEAQYKSLVERLKYHYNRFPKYANIVGHRELNSTKCPGDNGMKYLEMARSEVYNQSKAVIIVDIDKALQVLVNEGVISSPDYWRKACDVVIYLKELLIKVANKLQK